ELLPKGVPIVTAPRTMDILAGSGLRNVRELRWNESARIQTASGDIQVKAVEVKHWGARWRRDTYRGYVGYVLKRGGKSVLFGGDTALTSAFAELKGDHIDLAVMPIGSYGRDAR